MTDMALLLGKDITINNRITIHNPTLNEIIGYGESRYYRSLHYFTCTPSMYKVELDDAGLDYENTSDFELFCFLKGLLEEGDTRLILGELDLRNFDLMTNKETGENILFEKKTGIVINKEVHGFIADYLRKIIGAERIDEPIPDGMTKEEFISKERQNRESETNKPFKTHLSVLVKENREFGSLAISTFMMLLNGWTQSCDTDKFDDGTPAA